MKLNSQSATGVSSHIEQAQNFFARLQQNEIDIKLLSEQNQLVEFDLTDGMPFYIELINGAVTLKSGRFEPRSFDNPYLIHFQMSSATLERLFASEIRFSDALIPTNAAGEDSILLLECTLFKWSVLNWIGRLFRAAQLPARFRD